jgi:hypothetical protein
VSIFDLVLIASVLLSIATLAAAGLVAAVGRFRFAWQILRTWGIGVAVYLGIVVIVSLFTKPRLLAIGEDACFDDWCIAVEHIDKAQAGRLQKYSVTFRLSSRARRVSQRERNLETYLRDDRGSRYEANAAASSGEPFDVLLRPGDSVQAMRVYELPPEATHPQLMIAHNGFPIWWFIIGQGPFHKGIVLPLP